MGSFFVASVAGAAPTRPPILVTAPVDKVFVPSGFDDNDDVEVIVHGSFPNTCYKTGPVTGKVDASTGVVTVDVKAYLYQGERCAQMLVPFTQSVRLGAVPAGQYRIKVADRPAAATVPLVVATAQTSSPDDYLYAPVALVAVDEAGPGEIAVRIEGDYPYMLQGCMVLREVRTYMSPGQTLVVMPIAEIVVDDVQCAAQAANRRFAVSKTIGALPPDDYLVHVRVLDGNSLNRYFRVDEP
jgi:hypothetical protein